MCSRLKQSTRKPTEPMFGTKVWVRSGSEGPSHDPYSYDEINVETKGHDVCIHYGLAVWLEVDGKHTDYYGNEYEAFELFKLLTGAPPADFINWYYRARSRCSCGCRAQRSVPGYPGETLNICVR